MYNNTGTQIVCKAIINLVLCKWKALMQRMAFVSLISISSTVLHFVDEWQNKFWRVVLQSLSIHTMPVGQSEPHCVYISIKETYSIYIFTKHPVSLNSKYI